MSQQMEALAIAQAVRMGQAEVRQSLIAGGVDRAVELLLDPDEVAGSMRLDRFLASLHYYGAYRSMKLLDRAGMHRARLHRRLRELTDQERQRLADELATSQEDR